MKYALMQPYFLPYIGYWQLIHEVDIFVISDDTKYVKQSWINRNRFWINRQVGYVSIPLNHASDYLCINERTISPTFNPSMTFRRLMSDYKKCRNVSVEELLWKILHEEKCYLSEFLISSIELMISYLKLECKLMKASELGVPRNLKGQERIFHIGKKLHMTKYVNLPGGQNIYNPAVFQKNGIELEFIIPNLMEYPVKVNEYIPALSVMDLLFQITDEDQIQSYLNNYELQSRV